MYEGKLFPHRWLIYLKPHYSGSSLCVCVCLCVQKNMAGVAENNASTLGLGLDLDYRYQEAEKVLHSCIKTVFFSLITH